MTGEGRQKDAGRFKAKATDRAPQREYLTADEIYARRHRDVEHAQGTFRPYLPGTLHRDFLEFVWAMLNVPGTSRPRREPLAAAAALAHDPRFLLPGFELPDAKTELRQLRRRCEPNEVERLLREKIFPRALLNAHAGRHRRQRMKLGKPYRDRCGRWQRPFLKDHRGWVASLEPAELSLDRYVDWLRKEAYRLAAVDLLQTPAAATAEDPMQAGRELADLHAVLDAGDPAARTRLFALLDAIGATDRDLYRLNVEFHEMHGRHARIAEAVGFPTPDAARQAWNRLQRRLRRAAPHR